MDKKTEITPEQALHNLYAVCRSVSLPADQHDILRQCLTILKQSLDELDAIKSQRKAEGE